VTAGRRASRGCGAGSAAAARRCCHPGRQASRLGAAGAAQRSAAKRSRPASAPVPKLVLCSSLAPPACLARPKSQTCGGGRGQRLSSPGQVSGLGAHGHAAHAAAARDGARGGVVWCVWGGGRGVRARAPQPHLAGPAAQVLGCRGEQDVGGGEVAVDDVVAVQVGACSCSAGGGGGVPGDLLGRGWRVCV
jgi:hypothetical protein